MIKRIFLFWNRVLFSGFSLEASSSKEKDIESTKSETKVSDIVAEPSAHPEQKESAENKNTETVLEEGGKEEKIDSEREQVSSDTFDKQDHMDKIERHPSEKTLNTEQNNDTIAEVSGNFQSEEIEGKFLIVGASTAGTSHRDKDGEIETPCQDSFAQSTLKKWNILIVSDGAGSYENSHHGSAFTVEFLNKKIRDLLENRRITRITGDGEWRTIVLKLFRETLLELRKEAEKREMQLSSLSCTVNIAVFTDDVLLLAHIGDGRATYRTQSFEWRSAMRPFSGEMVGTTTFLTSQLTWDNPDRYIETRIVNDSIDTIGIISDGLENYAFTCYTRDNDGMYSDPNLPFKPFWDKISSSIQDMYLKQGLSTTQIASELKIFLEQSDRIKDENDDKTILVATRIHG